MLVLSYLQTSYTPFNREGVGLQLNEVLVTKARVGFKGED